MCDLLRSESVPHKPLRLHMDHAFDPLLRGNVREFYTSFGPIGASAISVETAWLWLLIGEIAFKERENATKN